MKKGRTTFSPTGRLPWPFRLDDLPEVHYGSPQLQRSAQHPTKQFLQSSFIQQLLRYFPRLDPWSRRHFYFQRRLTDGEPWHSALTAGYAGRREDELSRARSRLYRSHILQASMRLKALAEIYKLHAFAKLCNVIFFQKTATVC